MDADRIRFNVLRNALYHTARRRYYEWWARALNMLIILLGAAAIADALKGFGVGAIWIGVAVTFIGALQLVFDFGRQARDHQSFQRDYYRLLADIEAVPDADSAALARFYSEMLRITADEPPMLRAVDAKAYNDALDATEVFPEDQRLVIPGWALVFGTLATFEGKRFETLKERSERLSREQEQKEAA